MNLLVSVVHVPKKNGSAGQNLSVPCQKLLPCKRACSQRDTKTLDVLVPEINNQNSTFQLKVVNRE